MVMSANNQASLSVERTDAEFYRNRLGILACGSTDAIDDAELDRILALPSPLKEAEFVSFALRNSDRW